MDSPRRAHPDIGLSGTIACEPRSDLLLAGQNRALELIAGGAPLSDVLDFVARFIEEQASHLRCSVLVLEGDRLRLGAAPSLPAEYNAMTDGVLIGPLVGSCGTAAFTGQAVAVADITSDPRWASFPEAVRAATAGGLRACWSTPIIGTRGVVLGTFAIYYLEPSPPRPADLRLVTIATHVAGIAIERDRADRALAARAQRLAEADRRKDEFLALLAHELRNPLAPIVAAVHLCAPAAAAGGPLAHHLGIIERQTHQLARLIDDLLDVSRITRGQIVLRRERTTIAAALSSAVESARPLLDARRQALSVHLPDEPLWVDADPVRLAQILANLLNNAARYTNPGGHVAVRAERRGGAVVVEVRDDGIGIPAEMIGQIFDLFVQTDAARRRGQGGLGIGLTLVRRLVELHGGRVEASSEGEGRGSTFTVTLPVAPAEARPAPPPVAPAPSAGPRRVLVVDDNIDAADCLAEGLRAEGHEVRVEHDGLSALAAVEAWTPDAAVIDIGMPGMDGYEVARRLRASGGQVPLRLVALTGYGQESDARRARAAGFDAHLVKPAEMNRVVGALAG